MKRNGPTALTDEHAERPDAGTRPSAERAAPARLLASYPRQWLTLSWILTCVVLITTVGSLLVNRKVTDIYLHSLVTNQVWTNRVTRYVALRQLAGAVAQPADRALQTHDAAAESTRLRIAAERFAGALEAARDDLRTDAPTAASAELLDRLSDIEHATDRLHAGVKAQLAALSVGATNEATAHAAQSGHDLLEVNNAITRLTTRVRALQEAYLNSQLRPVRSLVRFQYPATVLTFIVVLAAFIHGYQLYRKMASVVGSIERTEEALRDSEARLRAITESAHDAVLMMDPQGRLSHWNPSAERILGYQQEEALGQDLHTLLVPPKYHAAHEATLPALVRTGQGPAAGETLELQARRKDGQEITVALSLSPARFQGQWHAIGILRDITELKRTESALRTRMAAIDAAADMVMITDVEGKIEYVNPAFTAVTGYGPEEVIGHSPRALKSGQQDQPFYESLWKTVLAGHVWQGELMNRRKDGRVYPEEMTITPVRDQAGAIIRFVAIKRDITTRKEQQALERERGHLKEAVAAMEQVLGVVGHELRTPLAGVRAITELLLTGQIDEAADVHRFMESVHHEVVRMADTVNDMLEAARIDSGRAKWNWAQVELAVVCAEAIETVRPLLQTPAVGLNFTVMPPALVMPGDPGAIRRLLINLLSNSTRYTQAGEIQVNVTQPPAGAPRWVQIEVRDTGSGIPAVMLDRLGESFALNAGVVGPHHCGGTGLGLAICKAIAAVHGGALSVRSTEGQGTTMRVSLRADLSGPVPPHADTRLERSLEVHTPSP